MKKLFFALMGMFLLSSCGDHYSSEADKAKRQATDNLMEQALEVVGSAPNIKKFTELKLVYTLYELRDDPKLQTFTYIVDMQGNLHELCKSLGYGIPYSAQSSNPERFLQSQRMGSELTDKKLPQAEPNGLFMPDGLSATWVICTDPNTGEMSPMYVEPTIIVSPFRLKHIAEYYGKKAEIEKGLSEVAKRTQEVLKEAQE